MTATDKLTLGQALRRARGDRTQEEVASLLGVRQMTLSRWERDEVLPEPSYDDRLRRFLGVSEVVMATFLWNSRGRTAVRLRQRREEDAGFAR